MEFDGVNSKEESNGKVERWVWREKEAIRDEVKRKSIIGNISIEITKFRVLACENFEKWCTRKIVQNFGNRERQCLQAMELGVLLPFYYMMLPSL